MCSMNRAAFRIDLRNISRLKPRHASRVYHRNMGSYTPFGSEEENTPPASDQAKSITDAHDNDTFFTESISRLQGSNDLIRPPAHVHAWGSAHWRKIHDVETSTHDINTSHEKQRPLLAQEEAAKSVSALTGSTTPDQKKERIAQLAKQIRFLFRHTPRPVAVLTARLYTYEGPGKLSSSDHGITVGSFNILPTKQQCLLALTIPLPEKDSFGLTGALISPIPPRTMIHLISATNDGAALAQAFSDGLKQDPFKNKEIHVSRVEGGLPLVQWDNGGGEGPGGVRVALACEVTKHKIILDTHAILVLDVQDALEPLQVSKKRKEYKDKYGIVKNVKKPVTTSLDGDMEKTKEESTSKDTTSMSLESDMQESTKPEAGTTKVEAEATTNAGPERASPDWKRVDKYLEQLEMPEQRGLITVSDTYRDLGAVIAYTPKMALFMKGKLKMGARELAQGLERARRLRLAGKELGKDSPRTLQEDPLAEAAPNLARAYRLNDVAALLGTISRVRNYVDRYRRRDRWSRPLLRREMALELENARRLKEAGQVPIRKTPVR